MKLKQSIGLLLILGSIFNTSWDYGGREPLIDLGVFIGVFIVGSFMFLWNSETIQKKTKPKRRARKR